MATQKEAAEEIGVTSKTLQNWLKIPGSPQASGRGGYNAVEILKWKVNVLEAEIKKLRAGDFDEFESGNQPESKELERLQEYAKLEERKVRTRLNQHKLNVAEKLYAPIQIIEDFAVRLATPLSVTLDALLPKLKNVWPDLPPEAEKLLDLEIANAQNELSNVNIDLSDYEESDQESIPQWIEGIEESDTTDGT